VLFNTVQSVWFPYYSRRYNASSNEALQISRPEDVAAHGLSSRQWHVVKQRLSGSAVQVPLWSRKTFAHNFSHFNTLEFWIQREHVYDKLSLVAEDILAAPASKAYVERVFSVCGLLTAGRRNIMSKSLQMRACLKLNRRVLASTDFNTTAWKYKTCSCVIM